MNLAAPAISSRGDALAEAPIIAGFAHRSGALGEESCVSQPPPNRLPARRMSRPGRDPADRAQCLQSAFPESAGQQRHLSLYRAVHPGLLAAGGAAGSALPQCAETLCRREESAARLAHPDAPALRRACSELCTHAVHVPFQLSADEPLRRPLVLAAG